MNTYIIIAVVVAGVTEWLKNFLPEKVKENGGAMAAIAGAFSVIAAVCYTLLTKFLDPTVVLTWQSFVVPAVIVIGLTQTCYNVLVQTFKAVKVKLTEKSKMDPDAIADEIADKISTGISESIEKAVK